MSVRQRKRKNEGPLPHDRKASFSLCLLPSPFPCFPEMRQCRKASFSLCLLPSPFPCFPVMRQWPFVLLSRCHTLTRGLLGLLCLPQRLLQFIILCSWPDGWPCACIRACTCAHAACTHAISTQLLKCDGWNIYIYTSACECRNVNCLALRRSAIMGECISYHICQLVLMYNYGRKH